MTVGGILDSTGIKGKARQILALLERREAGIFLVLEAAVVLGGLVYAVSLGNELRFPDEKDYVAIARNVAGFKIYSLDGVHPTAYRPPGYPLLLVPFLCLGAGIVQLRAINFLLLAASLHLMRRLVSTIGSRESALIAVFLVLGYPVLFYTAGTLYPQTFASVLLLVFLNLILRSTVRSLDACMAGVVMGYLLLTVPTFGFVLAAGVIYLGFSQRKLLPSALVLGTALVVLVPWTVRNYAVFHTLIPFATNSGLQLHFANSAGSSAGASVATIDLSKSPCEVLDMTEIQRDSCHKAAAVEYMLNNKLRALTLYFMRVVHFFSFRNELTMKAESALWKDIVMFVTYGPLLALLLLRICRRRQLRPNSPTQFLLFLYLSAPFLQAIFLTRIRYRLPFDFLLIALDAVMVMHLLSDEPKAPAEGRPPGQVEADCTHVMEDRGIEL